MQDTVWYVIFIIHLFVHTKHTTTKAPNPALLAPVRPTPSSKMRAVDMSRNRIIKAGIQWPFPDATPNSKHMIPLLERNEALVTWLQPHDGKVTDQFPVIRISDQYYTLSLRQMKALWKHVKLRKNFVNRETIPHIGTKLRIPEVLLMEKMRTQQRFNVSADARLFSRLYINRAHTHRSCASPPTDAATRP